ncbi:MAG: molybdenum cofactor guanylyltransferase [Sulfuritalea sp.]|nr:molybdenum cofactor guanylyltransferase [Sulfuritalea sp.]
MSTRVTGVVLAGGQGRRMGGVDKGLQDLNGRPMIQWVLDRLAPQVDAIRISANQNLLRYGEFGYPVFSDRVPDFAGPLAGLHAALAETESPLVATVPCDSPLLPSDLVHRLHAALSAKKADLAVARTGSQVHRAFCIVRRELLPQLEAFLDTGERKVGLWHATLNIVEVAFDDQPESFGNINTLEELRALRKPD